jgi:pSer/pThr/pTyr-binding forkhead associated (FHA) protein
VDLDSINGTFVNNRRALPTKRYALMDGDEITVGRLKLTIRYK